jgi:acyl-CoA thioesterase
MDPADQTEFELDRAVASTRTAEGIHAVVMTEEWNTPNGTPNGGYVLAVVLNAIRQESPLPDPLSVSITYFRPPVAGDAQVEVKPLRVGKRVATFQADLTQDDQPIVHAVASFHDVDAAGDLEHLTPAPAFPRPEDCLDVWDGMELDAGIIDRFEYRLAEVPGWMRGEPSGDMSATFWIRPADERPVDAFAAAVLVDAYPPVSTEIGHIMSATVQMTVHFRRRVSTSWVLGHVVTRHVIDGYHEEDMDLWDADGRLFAQSRQLAILR